MLSTVVLVAQVPVFIVAFFSLTSLYDNFTFAPATEMALGHEAEKPSTAAMAVIPDP